MTKTQNIQILNDPDEWTEYLTAYYHGENVAMTLADIAMQFNKDALTNMNADDAFSAVYSTAIREIITIQGRLKPDKFDRAYELAGDVAGHVRSMVRKPPPEGGK